jgi:hypothetical protein
MSDLEAQINALKAQIKDYNNRISEIEEINKQQRQYSQELNALELEAELSQHKRELADLEEDQKRLKAVGPNGGGKKKKKRKTNKKSKRHKKSTRKKSTRKKSTRKRLSHKK